MSEHSFAANIADVRVRVIFNVWPRETFAISTNWTINQARARQPQ